jgi:hypothetical protein
LNTGKITNNNDDMLVLDTGALSGEEADAIEDLCIELIGMLKYGNGPLTNGRYQIGLPTRQTRWINEETGEFKSYEEIIREGLYVLRDRLGPDQAMDQLRSVVNRVGTPEGDLRWDLLQEAVANPEAGALKLAIDGDMTNLLESEPIGEALTGGNIDDDDPDPI